MNQDKAQTNFTFLAGLVGCGSLEPKPELSCVRNVSAVTLENALSNYLISGVKPSVSFTPVPDNVTIFSNLTDRAVRGLVANIVSYFYRESEIKLTSLACHSWK